MWPGEKIELMCSFIRLSSSSFLLTVLHHDRFLIFSFLSITLTVSFCSHNVDKVLSPPTTSSLSTSLPLHLSLPFHLTHSHFPISLSSTIQISLFLSLSLSPSQVTPARPLIRILSLSKCIVTGGWQLCVCVCVFTRVWVCDSLGSLLAVTMAAAWHF